MKETLRQIRVEGERKFEFPAGIEEGYFVESLGLKDEALEKMGEGRMGFLARGLRVGLEPEAKGKVEGPEHGKRSDFIDEQYNGENVAFELGKDVGGVLRKIEKGKRDKFSMSVVGTEGMRGGWDERLEEKIFSGIERIAEEDYREGLYDLVEDALKVSKEEAGIKRGIVRRDLARMERVVSRILKKRAELPSESSRGTRGWGKEELKPLVPEKAKKALRVGGVLTMFAGAGACSVQETPVVWETETPVESMGESGSSSELPVQPEFTPTPTEVVIPTPEHIEKNFSYPERPSILLGAGGSDEEVKSQLKEMTEGGFEKMRYFLANRLFEDKGWELPVNLTSEELEEALQSEGYEFLQAVNSESGEWSVVIRNNNSGNMLVAEKNGTPYLGLMPWDAESISDFELREIESEGQDRLVEGRSGFNLIGGFDDEGRMISFYSAKENKVVSLVPEGELPLGWAWESGDFSSILNSEGEVVYEYEGGEWVGVVSKEEVWGELVESYEEGLQTREVEGRKEVYREVEWVMPEEYADEIRKEDQVVAVWEDDLMMRVREKEEVNLIERFENGVWKEMEIPEDLHEIEFFDKYEGDWYGIDEYGLAEVVLQEGEWVEYEMPFSVVGGQNGFYEPLDRNIREKVIPLVENEIDLSQYKGLKDIEGRNLNYGFLMKDYLDDDSETLNHMYVVGIPRAILQFDDYEWEFGIYEIPTRYERYVMLLAIPDAWEDRDYTSIYGYDNSADRGVLNSTYIRTHGGLRSFFNDALNEDRQLIFALAVDDKLSQVLEERWSYNTDMPIFSEYLQNGLSYDEIFHFIPRLMRIWGDKSWVNEMGYIE